MMYISVYPIAMSVRNTNVYEEQSLGLFDQDDVEDAEQGVELENNLASGRHVRGALLVIMDSMFYAVFFQVWGRYLAYHARRQLAFDMWWISSAVILICIFERRPLSDPANLTWYGIFPISESRLFEMVLGVHPCRSLRSCLGLWWGRSQSWSPLRTLAWTLKSTLACR